MRRQEQSVSPPRFLPGTERKYTMPNTQENLPAPNYDENKVPQFILPSPLLKDDGSSVNSAEEWENSQREKIRVMLQTHMYGEIPPAPEKVTCTVTGEKSVFGGSGIRRSIRLSFSDRFAENFNFDLLMYLPRNCQKAVPCAIGLNFAGNHSVEDDQDISLPDYPWCNTDIPGRGTQHRRWVPEYLLERGFALITGCYNQLFPDYPEGTQKSIYKLFHSPETLAEKKPGELTAISAWSWGLIRIMDLIEKTPEIDQQKVIVTGHSRLGKTSLWAGANDTRFSVIVSNNSGCGGAALTKREFGETMHVMNRIFPHWLTPQAKIDGDRPQEIAYDQNFLLSLAAPRALAVASADEDIWADPKGEFLGLTGTNDVYALYGRAPIAETTIPGRGESVDNGIRHYHCRAGKHDILYFDWQIYLDFALRVWSRA